MVRKSYRTHLKSATDEAQVLAFVRRYLEEWSAEEIDVLPAGAWPRTPTRARDVLDHSARLGSLHAGYQGDPGPLAALQELLLFFTHAAVRLTRLQVLQADTDCPQHARTRRKPSAVRPSRKRPQPA